jgi:NitT/TauT family transport system substrate-binding protein
MTIKKLVMFMSVLLVASGVAACSAAAPPTPAPSPPLRIGYNKWVGYGALFIAAEKGFFKQEGVEVEIAVYDTYSEGYAELVEKKLAATCGTLADATVQGSTYTPRQTIWLFDLSLGGDVVVGRGDLSGPEDLRGKKIGAGAGTFSQVFVAAGLEKFGLSTDDVTLIDVKEDAVPQEMESGLIDAGHTWEPYLSEALDNGGKILFTSADTPGVVVDVLIFRQDVIEERPQDVQALVRGLAKAEEFWRANPAEGNAIVARATEIPEDEIVAILTGVKVASLADNVTAMNETGEQSLYQAVRFTGDFFVKEGIIQTPPDAGQLINPTFVQAAAGK